MGMKMQASSSPGSSPANDGDIALPDIPPSETDNENGDAKVALDAIFDEDDLDDDDVLTSSAAIPSSPPVLVPAPLEVSPNPTPVESFSDQNVMQQFYARLFPFRSLFQWLNHSVKPGPDFANREFALTIPKNGEDIYLRYQSYQTADLLRKDILRHNPSRFEIGPVYTTNPRDRKSLRNSSAFKPLSKEIVFDIDLSDYNNVRTCCTKANICTKCWVFATMAIKVVDVALRDDFGFENILWVYSGRRGVHAWISDKDARELDDEKRKAITGYFDVIKGGDQNVKKVNVRRPLHHHLQRSLDILKPYFQQNILVEQEPFLSQEGQDGLLQLLPDKTLVEALKKKWASSPDRPSSRKWADIDALAAAGVSKTLDTKALMEAKQDIVLEYTYPRLDVEVGKKRIHLLKSPFVVHPGTGRVCVPITFGGDMDKADAFDPFSVPKVTDLLKEIDDYGSQHTKEMEGSDEGNATIKKLSDWEKTSLKPYVEAFETHVKELLKIENVRVKREREDDGATGPEGMEF